MPRIAKLSLRVVQQREIAASLKRLGWSIPRLAREAGVNRDQLNRFLNHDANTSLVWLDRVKRAIGRELRRLAREQPGLDEFSTGELDESDGG